MSDNTRIEELLDNLEPHQTPEDVCGDDVNLLREVRARWERMRHVKNQLDDFFPTRSKRLVPGQRVSLRPMNQGAREKRL